jgi:beta-lactamase superfamily II metal-dependent hydrolase
MRTQRPKKIEGAALYSINASERIDWNIGSFILKTREGKIIVIDGGHGEELPRLIECLKEVSGEEVPTVSAWLFSHLHDDHHGAYLRMVRDEEWHGKVTVKEVYHHFLPREFYTDITKEASAHFGPEYDAIMGSDKTLGATLHTVKVGDRITVDEIDFDVLHIPDISFGKQMNVNDTSVVYKMTYDKGQTVMFLGDAEWIGSNDLVDNHAAELKSDIVQVGHHGCGSCSDECYRLIGAKVYIWQCGERFWYQESGEGTNTHNVGFIRYRAFMKEIGVKNENVYVTLGDIDSFPLPMPIY